MLTNLLQQLRLRKAVLAIHLHYDGYCDYARACGLRVSFGLGSTLQSQLPIIQFRNIA